MRCVLEKGRVTKGHVCHVGKGGLGGRHAQGREKGGKRNDKTKFCLKYSTRKLNSLYADDNFKKRAPIQ